ncbi:sulfotransferase family protein [Hypericibacter sp.]|uniref:sulfotransferase family protein n=1 Tax=Hypericibacter sp. TaxID=2705401 RepID=UPI003D6CCA9D
MSERPADDARLGSFQVAGWMDALGTVLCQRGAVMRAAARWESRLLRDRLDRQPITAPVWITGLARSGSTMLLELLASHPQLASHRYRDFPPVLTPYLWNRLLGFMPLKAELPAERAHHDGIMVTSDSPEAFEEPAWMAFFPDLHQTPHSALLDSRTDEPAFEAFLRDHMRKLMLVRDRPRYLAKANYDSTRHGYLLKLFPDARFIVPIREPLWHVASLMKQHRLFCEAQARYPAARRHLARAGHYEFGLDRQPIDCGNSDATAEIRALRQAGREAEGWALQWAGLYGLMAKEIETDDALADAILMVRYEDLVATPRKTLIRILAHADLEPDEALLRQAEERLHRPDYYRLKFSPMEAEAVRERTATVASCFGYA